MKINNGTTKVVKKIKVTGEVVRQSESTFGLLIFFLTEVLLSLSVEQLTNVVLYSSDTYSKTVCSEEFG